MANTSHRLAWLFLVLALPACVSRPVPPLEVQERELRGKVGVVWPGESFSARFHWQQGGGAYRLELWGPFGQGRAILKGDAEHLAMLDGRGRVLEEGPVEAVMRARLGWWLPLAALPAWADGGPSRVHPFRIEARDDQGRVTEFLQFGWRVRVDAFADADPPLPERLSLERAPYRVRIAFSGRAAAAAAGSGEAD